MRRILQGYFVGKSRPSYVFIRGAASEPVVQCIEGSDKSVTHGQHWQPHENLVLIAAIVKQEQDSKKISTEQTRREKWEEIESFCQDNGISRSAEQCRQRWIRLSHAFSKVKGWERCRPPGKSSFWLMKPGDKKMEGLSFSLDMQTFKAMDALHNEEVASTGNDGPDIEAVSFESPAELNSGNAETEASMTDGAHENNVEINNGPSEMDYKDKVKTNDGPSEVDLCKDKGSSDLSEHFVENSESNKGSSEETSISSTSYMPQTKVTNMDEDRPMVLVSILNQCLHSLKGCTLDRDEACKEDTPIKNAESTKEFSGSSSMGATTCEKRGRV